MNTSQSTTRLSQPTKTGLLLSSVSVVIPAYNDEGTIGRLITDVDCLMQELCNDYEIVVVNDGSKDNTLSVINSMKNSVPRLRVVNHEVNQGYGYTIRELYFIGSKDLVFSLPGDYQYAPKEIIAMAEGLRNNNLVIGKRIKRNDPPKRKLQSMVYNFMLRMFYGIKHTDVNSIKLFRRSILNSIELVSQSPFVDAELCIRTEKAGLGVVEIPIEHLPRMTQGASGGKISVIMDTFGDLLNMRGHIK